MGLRRSDLGLVVSLVAAAVLIGVFLAMTGGPPPDEEADKPTSTAAQSSSTTAAPTTDPPTGRLVRYPSFQVSELPWSRARGVFNIQCQGEQLIRLDARITSLPGNRRYAWRVITGDANETVALSRTPGLRADLVVGVGRPSSFAPEAGTTSLRFAFDGPPPPDGLGLYVLGVPLSRSFVIATPRTTCQR